MKDRRDLKLETKRHRTEDGQDVEFYVVETDYNISKKSTGANDPGGGPFFEGYASIKNSYDSYMDKIIDGAYKESLKEKGPREVKGKKRSRIKSLWQHDPEMPFGLPHEAEEDSKGLYHKTKVSDTPENMTRLTYMEDTVVDGQSIGFVTLDSDWEETEDEDDFWPPRILKKIDLWEWSPVTFPAHSEALTAMITRNREIVSAAQAVDTKALLNTAWGMKEVTVPAVEEALAMIGMVVTRMKSEEGAEEDSEEEGEEPEEDNPVDSGETSAEDPELVKQIEAFQFRVQAAALAEKHRLATLTSRR